MSKFAEAPEFKDVEYIPAPRMLTALALNVSDAVLLMHVPGGNTTTVLGNGVVPVAAMAAGGLRLGGDGRQVP